MKVTIEAADTFKPYDMVMRVETQEEHDVLNYFTCFTVQVPDVVERAAGTTACPIMKGYGSTRARSVVKNCLEQMHSSLRKLK